MKSGSVNFLEPSGPVQACNGIDLPFLTFIQDMQLKCVDWIIDSGEGHVVGCCEYDMNVCV